MVDLDSVIVYTLGVFLGGLSNLCIFRIPKGEAMLPPSHLFKVKQVMRYLLVTALVMLILQLLYQRFGVSLKGLTYMILSVCLVISSFIDLEHRIIPNSINYFLGISGIFFLLMGWTVSLMDGLLGFAAGGGVLLAIGLLSIWILRKEGMGGGDIKQAAVCGLYIGVERTILSFFITSCLAFIMVLILFVSGKVKKGQYLPFGPFLSAGTIIVILFYEDIIHYYYQWIV